MTMKRPHDTGALPATKRRNRSSNVHTPSSVGSPVKDVESIRDQAEPYRLATAKFPIDALTPIWTVGANRPINQAHKRRLCRIFQQQGVLRKEISHRLRIACTKAEVEKMQHHVRRQLGPETRPENEDGSVPARDSEWPSFDDWMQVNGSKAELMAGNHRVEALKEYVQRLELGDGERWWICDIYDKDSLPRDLHVQLRANREDLILPDSHGQIWAELSTLSSSNDGLFQGSTRVVEQQMVEYLGLSSGAKFPLRRLGTLWRNQNWKPVITSWCQFLMGQSTFNISTFEWMASCRIDDFWFTTFQQVIETLRCLHRECGVDVSASDWARLTRLRSDRGANDVAELFYPGIPSEDNDGRVGMARLRVKDFFSTQDEDGYNRVYAAVLRCPEMRFPDVHAVLKTTKVEGKVMSTVVAHVVQWLNRCPTQVGDRDSNKPLLRHDLLPPLRALYGDEAEPKSLELERKVLAYVREHTNDFINPSLEHYLQAYPDGHCDDYIERFEHESWRTVLTIVYDITGPHFQHEALFHFNTNNPSSLDSKPVSAIAQVLCHSLSRIPEVSRNPALQGKKAAEALCHEIHPLVMTWAARQCEDALTDCGSQWPPATIQLVQAEQAKYQALAPARPARGPERARSVRDVGIQTTVPEEFERPWTRKSRHPVSLAGDMSRENGPTGRHSKDLDPNLTRRAPISPTPWRPRQASQAPILAIGGSERQHNGHTSSSGRVHLAHASHSTPSWSQVPPNQTKPAGGRSWRKRPAVISGKRTL